MNLPGRLRLTTLGDVLGALCRGGATGVLELTEIQGAGIGRVHRVHLAGGFVVHVDSAVSAARLGDILRRCGTVGDMVLLRLAERLVLSPGRLAGELLVELGAVTPAEVTAALGLQRRERLERLFSLEDARLAFRVARPKAQVDPKAPLSSAEFLGGRARTRSRNGEFSSAGSRKDPVRVRALETLGLSETADRASIQRAFRQLASRLHPDRFPTVAATDRADLIRKFAEITAAYHALVA
jgi:DnaJ domain